MSAPPVLVLQSEESHPTKAITSTDVAACYAQFGAVHPPHIAEIAGHRWTWREGGRPDAPPVLLLPGALGRPETSFEYITALEPDFRVLAPGYPVALTTMSGLADGIAALLDVCRVDKAAVVGGSFGGLVAQTFAARHARRVGSLVLSDTSPPLLRRARRMSFCASAIGALPFGVTRRVLRFGVARYVASLPQAIRSFWRTHFAEMVSMLSKAEIENRARAWCEFDRMFLAADTSRPVLVLCAESDRAVSPQAFARQYPNATIHIISSPLGHAASIGDANAYIAPMCAFLRRQIG